MKFILGFAVFLASFTHAFSPDPGKNPASATGSAWILSTDRFDNGFEAEPFVGNGHIGLRVPAAGMGFLDGLGQVGWPLGTERVASAIAAGLYAKVAEGIFYQDPKEAIALIPNWSTLTFADSSGTYSPATASAANVSHYEQHLDLRTGTVTTAGIWTSPAGKQTRFEYRVVTDRAHGDRALVTLSLTPHWNGRAVVESLLDEAGARRLERLSAGADPTTHTIRLNYETIGTGIRVAEAAQLQSSCELTPIAHRNPSPAAASERTSFEARTGKTCTFAKYVAVVTGRDSNTPEEDAVAESQRAAAAGVAAFERENRAAWDVIWKADIEVDADPALQQVIRANEYTLFASIASDSPDSLGPSGLTSDGYAGMIFWDADTWMFPALVAEHPSLARVMVDYRSDTLPAARKNAAQNGYQGALYPWTSGLSGDMGDECYGAVTDAAGKVLSDPNKSCTQQLHLQSDVALAQWEYYHATGDITWLAQRGWPVLEAVAQFWESKVTKVPDGYAIRNVQTPDEYATDTDNDAYTNAGAALELEAATRAAAVLGKPAPASWARIAAGLIKTLRVDPDRNIYVEHDGYDGEKIKQADVVMLTYPLDFPMPRERAINDLNYYTPRTDVDGPAMTDAIHAIAASAVDAPGCSAYTYLLRSYQPFLRSPYLQFSEFAPVRLTHTSFDFLTGVGGFMQEFLFGFSGYRPLARAVHLDPSLPPQLAGLTLRNLVWQGRTFTVHIGPRQTSIILNDGPALPLETPSGPKTVRSDAPLLITTRRSDLQPTDNLARCRPVRASSSLPGSPAVAAVDGIPATAWVAAEAHAEFTIQLTTAATVGSVGVALGNSAPLEYSVKLSMDRSHWTTVAETSSRPPVSGDRTQVLEFAPTVARFVRLVFPGNGDAQPPNITEIVVRPKAN
jgi:trehalose/maltose hydrolase-like predicted phosphorylase